MRPPPVKESLPQTEGGSGSLDTAHSPCLFIQTQKQASTALPEKGHQVRGSGCEAGPASRLDKGSEPQALAMPSQRAKSPSRARCSSSRPKGHPMHFSRHGTK